MRRDLDSGLARAENVAVATLLGYTLPNDSGASTYYFPRDIIKPEVKLDGTFVDDTDTPGMGMTSIGKLLTTS